MDVYEHLTHHRVPLCNWPDNLGPGVYALFAVDRSCLPRTDLPQDGLVYIGQSGNLKDRNHFMARDSGFSTVRRSVGAILKAELRLTAIPRAAGSSATNIQNFRFADDGEERLTNWMLANLECSNYRHDGDIVALERQLIADHGPPLCLKLWRNPQGRAIRALRKFCRDEASTFRSAL